MPDSDTDESEGEGEDADEEQGSPTSMFDDATQSAMGQRFKGDDDEQEENAEEDVDDGGAAAESSDSSDEGSDAGAGAEAVEETASSDGGGEPEGGSASSGEGAAVSERQMMSEELLAEAMAMEEPQVEAVQDRPQVPAYLPEPLAEAVRKRAEEFNARRTLKGKDPVDVHRGFQEGVWRFVLSEMSDEDLEEYLPPWA